MPTSVLLAVLAAAGLLALAPALVHRYDAVERLAAERALSTARVIERRRRPRTVPGPRPINPPRWLLTLAASAASAGPVDSSGASSADGGGLARLFRFAGRVRAVPAGRLRSFSGAGAGRLRSSVGGGAGRLGSSGPAAGRSRRRAPVRRHTPAVYRRRRVLAALVLLNASELCGVGLLGPGFWIGSAPSLMLLAAYLVHLRNRALVERRRRRAAARRAAWLAARHAELRREQARRLALRRDAARRAAAARVAAQRESTRLSQRYVRGRPYEARVSGWY